MCYWWRRNARTLASPPPPLILSSDDGQLCLTISSQAQVAIRTEAIRRHPLETGGILLGTLSSNLRLATVVVAAAPPSDSRHGRTSFQRGVKGVRKMIARSGRQTPPLYYLGEWHTHPGASPEASNPDLHQMSEAVRTHLEGARTPILLIAGGEPSVGLKLQASLHRPGQSPMYLQPL